MKFDNKMNNYLGYLNNFNILWNIFDIYYLIHSRISNIIINMFNFIIIDLKNMINNMLDFICMFDNLKNLKVKL